MKQSISYIFLFLAILCKSQALELKDKSLIRYYELTNEAENKIINNDLLQANNLYKEAFNEFKYPHAKDLQNSMTVALKINDLETAYACFQSLKCLGKKFDDDFSTNNFKSIEKYKVAPCQNAINSNYKKSLDSLVNLDQYYRKLSKGNYQAYKKELTKNDSITSTNLLKIIQRKGFPNEYNIGLEMKSWIYFHDFYLIIWHQLASNLYSPQRVNFSGEIIKALNEGKIRPDIAGFLLDLSNNTNNYSYFKISQFVTNDGKIDCCYVGKDFLPENRTEISLKKIKEVNKKRKQLGLSSTEDEIRKSIFYLNHKDYVFSNNVIEGWNFNNNNDIEMFKKNLIKLDDTAH
ncbi:hypothetical protein [Chryseobacterium sp. MEBOG07]|uniref:hypothetical protein n=1 Tax=Chryseobacterium sp. MEBOG07 TaxID=2879939 RepID=UPI001F3B42AE|nr:hypothetical protein [Chryseobacterium sp. MEBOG07]UKB78529.1 hypothetical protein LF886_18960 [Chryseobacterium sp. MEBOG07]